MILSFLVSPFGLALVMLALIGGLFAFFLVRDNRRMRLQRSSARKVVAKKEETPNPKRSSLQNEHDHWLSQVEVIMLENLGNPDLNIADLADQMDISRTHFFRKIKSTTGMTPNQYLQEARLQAAKQHLENDGYGTVKALSICVGFKKPSYFSTLFKERFGVSPADYFHQNQT